MLILEVKVKIKGNVIKKLLDMVNLEGNRISYLIEWGWKVCISSREIF